MRGCFHAGPGYGWCTGPSGAGSGGRQEAGGGTHGGPTAVVAAAAGLLLLLLRAPAAAAASAPRAAVTATVVSARSMASPTSNGGYGSGRDLALGLSPARSQSATQDFEFMHSYINTTSM